MKRLLVFILSCHILLTAIGCAADPVLQTYVDESCSETQVTTVTPTESSEMETELITENPLDVPETTVPPAAGLTAETVCAWFTSTISEPFIVDESEAHYRIFSAPLITGGTVRIEEVDGFYLQTVFFTKYSDSIETQATEFLMCWLGRNLTDIEKQEIGTAIKAAQSGNVAQINSVFPEGIIVYVIVDASFGCQISVQGG